MVGSHHFLSLEILLNDLFWRIPARSNIIRWVPEMTFPQHVSQGRILFKEFLGSDPLHDLNNGGRSKFWMGRDKEVNVISHDFPGTQSEPLILSD